MSRPRPGSRCSGSREHSIPVAIGIAILRYRLFEIDRIISRTIAYGLITAVLVATYAAIILILQGPLGGLFGGDTISVALSTLLVAALFQPVRRRVQTRGRPALRPGTDRRRPDDRRVLGTAPIRDRHRDRYDRLARDDPRDDPAGSTRRLAAGGRAMMRRVPGRSRSSGCSPRWSAAVGAIAVRIVDPVPIVPARSGSARPALVGFEFPRASPSPRSGRSSSCAARRTRSAGAWC